MIYSKVYYIVMQSTLKELTHDRVTLNAVIILEGRVHAVDSELGLLRDS